MSHLSNNQNYCPKDGLCAYKKSQNWCTTWCGMRATASSKYLKNSKMHPVASGGQVNQKC